MIEVIINYRNSNMVSFSIQGHAGYADPGEDIYCAGVSAISQTALLGLIKHLRNEPCYRVEKGDLFCELPDILTRDEMEKAQIILSTMEAGLLSMQDIYGDFIKVDIRRM